MNKMKNSIVYRVFFVGFLSVLSICLLLLPFALNKTNTIDLGSSFESNRLHLDETTQTEYQFTGSALQWEISYYRGSYQPGSAMSSTRNYYYQNVTHFPMLVSFDFDSATKTLVSHYLCRGLQVLNNNLMYIYSQSTKTVSMVVETRTYFDVGQLSYAGVVLGYVRGSYLLPVDFNFDIRGVTISSVISPESNANVNYIVYEFLDSNGVALEIRIYTLGDTDDFMPSSRTYFFTQGQTLTDNNYYNQGFKDGRREGLAEGDTLGYNRGSREGFDNGKYAGYLEGLEAGSDISFLSLISATIDAPVNAITGLFDLNISLGGSTFNLKDFMIAILSVALVIAFVRLIMAK